MGLFIYLRNQHKMSKQLSKNPFDTKLKNKCNKYTNLLSTLYIVSSLINEVKKYTIKM